MRQDSLLRIGALLLWIATLVTILPGTLLRAADVTIVGTVTNGTTGQPAADISVSLLALQRQMATIADTVTDDDGKFRLTVDASAQERFLVQASFGGVNYNKSVVIFSAETTTVDITVFNSGAKLSDLRIREHAFIFLPEDGKVGITEFFTVQNQTEPPRAYVPGAEGFRFGIADGATDIGVTVSTQSGMPLRQQSQLSSHDGQRTIGYEFRPGETQVQVSYFVPFSGEVFEFKAALPLPALARFAVIPAGGVEITSPGVGETPDTRSPDRRIFQLTDPNADSFAATLKIDAEELARFMANPPTAPAAAGTTPPARQNPIHLIPQPVNEKQIYIVGLGLFVLTCGLYYLTLLDATPSTKHEADTKADAARNSN